MVNLIMNNTTVIGMESHKSANTEENNFVQIKHPLTHIHTYKYIYIYYQLSCRLMNDG